MVEIVLDSYVCLCKKLFNFEKQKCGQILCARAGKLLEMGDGNFKQIIKLQSS